MKQYLLALLLIISSNLHCAITLHDFLEKYPNYSKDSSLKKEFPLIQKLFENKDEVTAREVLEVLTHLQKDKTSQERVQEIVFNVLKGYCLSFGAAYIQNAVGTLWDPHQGLGLRTEEQNASKLVTIALKLIIAMPESFLEYIYFGEKGAFEGITYALYKELTRSYPEISGGKVLGAYGARMALLGSYLGIKEWGTSRDSSRDPEHFQKQCYENSKAVKNHFVEYHAHMNGVQIVSQLLLLVGLASYKKYNSHQVLEKYKDIILFLQEEREKNTIEFSSGDRYVVSENEHGVILRPIASLKAK